MIFKAYPYHHAFSKLRCGRSVGTYQMEKDSLCYAVVNQPFYPDFSDSHKIMSWDAAGYFCKHSYFSQSL